MAKLTMKNIPEKEVQNSDNEYKESLTIKNNIICATISFIAISIMVIFTVLIFYDV